MFLQNNSTTICNIQLFAEDWISQSASVVSYCIGFIGSIIWTKKSLQEICDSSQNWTIFSIFRTWIKALVSKALYYIQNFLESWMSKDMKYFFTIRFQFLFVLLWDLISHSYGSTTVQNFASTKHFWNQVCLSLPGYQ